MEERFEQASSVLFPIAERPVFVDGIQVENKKAIVRTDTGAVLGVVGNRYTPMDNTEVMQHIDSILDNAGLEYELVKGHAARGGARTAIEISFPQKRIVVDGKDEMFLRAFVGNSFDMSAAVTLDLGFFRIVCSNGAMVGTREKQISIGHYSYVQERTVKELMEYLGSKFEATQDFIRSLTQHSFRSASEVGDLLAGNDIIAEKYRSGLIDAWEETGHSTSAWQIFNLYTSAITHRVKASQFSKMAMLNALSREARQWLGEEAQPLQLAA